MCVIAYTTVNCEIFVVRIFRIAWSMQKQGTQCVQTLGVFKLMYMFITNAHAHMCLRHACGQRTCTSRRPA